MPVSGVALGSLEIAPQRPAHAGELRMRGQCSPLRNVGQRNFDTDVSACHGTERLDGDGIFPAGKLVVFQPGVDAATPYKMIVKNSPGHTSGAIKAGGTEAIPLHHINLDAALRVEIGPEQYPTKGTAVLHGNAQVCNKGFEQRIDAVRPGTAGDKAFHFQCGQPGQLGGNALRQAQTVQRVFAAVTPWAAGIVHLCPEGDGTLHGGRHADADGSVLPEPEPGLLPQPRKQFVKHYLALQSAQRMSGANIV